MKFEDLLLQPPNAELVLEDGTKFEGYSFGADVSVSGEAVFTTGLKLFPNIYIKSIFNNITILI